jgi:hypothetical protein
MQRLQWPAPRAPAPANDHGARGVVYRVSRWQFFARSAPIIVSGMEHMIAHFVGRRTWFELSDPGKVHVRLEAKTPKCSRVKPTSLEWLAWLAGHAAPRARFLEMGEHGGQKATRPAEVMDENRRTSVLRRSPSPTPAPLFGISHSSRARRPQNCSPCAIGVLLRPSS